MQRQYCVDVSPSARSIRSETPRGSMKSLHGGNVSHDLSYEFLVVGVFGILIDR